MVINASWGLGEALVSGQVDPDEFVVRKSDGELLWSRIGEKGDADATDGRVAHAGAGRASWPRAARGIERHYGAPQDVEWCHDGDASFWIVQSRPVTTGARAAPTRPSGRAPTSPRCCPT